MNLSFKKFFLLKESPDSANFRIRSNNYYADYANPKYNPITFNVYNKNFLVYSYTEFNYHNPISRKLIGRIFDPVSYYKTHRPNSEYINFKENFLKNDFASSYFSFIKNETLDRIKKDLEEENIFFIGDLNRSIIRSLEKIHTVEKFTDSTFFTVRPENTPDFILGRMFSMPIKEFQDETNESLIPCFSIWNRLKDLTSEAAEMMLKLPPIYDLDPNKSIIENRGLESKMLRSFIK
jgi:hypothetical protein